MRVTQTKVLGKGKKVGSEKVGRCGGNGMRWKRRWMVDSTISVRMIQSTTVIAESAEPPQGFKLINH